MLLPPSLEAEIRGLCHQHMPDATVPRVFLECPDIPKTVTGKPDRRALPLPPEGLLVAIADRSHSRRPQEEEPAPDKPLEDAPDRLPPNVADPEAEEAELCRHLESQLLAITGLTPPLDATVPLQQLPWATQTAAFRLSFPDCDFLFFVSAQ